MYIDDFFAMIISIRLQTCSVIFYACNIVIPAVVYLFVAHIVSVMRYIRPLGS